LNRLACRAGVQYMTPPTTAAPINSAANMASAAPRVGAGELREPTAVMTRAAAGGTAGQQQAAAGSQRSLWERDESAAPSARACAEEAADDEQRGNALLQGSGAGRARSAHAQARPGSCAQAQRVAPCAAKALRQLALSGTPQRACSRSSLHRCTAVPHDSCAPDSWRQRFSLLTHLTCSMPQAPLLRVQAVPGCAVSAFLSACCQRSAHSLASPPQQMRHGGRRGAAAGAGRVAGV
jgi:hypothetical protein